MDPYRDKVTNEGDRLHKGIERKVEITLPNELTYKAFI